MVSSRRAAGFVLLLLAAGGMARGRGLGVDSLLTNNPFGGAPKGAAAAAPAGPELQLRGLMTEGEDTYFSLYDPASKTAAWVRTGEAGEPFVVKTYDAAQESVVVSYQGRDVTLRLKDTRSDGNAAGQAAFARAERRQAQPVISPQFVQAETKRLAGILAEIRRRRAEREALEKR